MKLTTNFRIQPSVDFYTAINFTAGNKVKNEVKTDLDYKDLLDKAAVEDLTPEGILTIDKKIENYCLSNMKPSKDEWRELSMYKPPISAIVNYTKEELKCNIPIMPIKTAMFLPRSKKRKNKMMCFTPNVLYIQQLCCDTDISIQSAVFTTLRDMGITIEFSNNDFELNGKKCFGFIVEEISDFYFFCEAMITFKYEDEIFKNLPSKYYSRSYKEGKIDGEQGITGILNEYPDFNVNEFISNFLITIGYGI